jgi:voltage-gated sodium channel type II alpha
MSIDSDSYIEEKSIFRPFTRESLQAIEQRIAEEHARQKELDRKRAEGQVSDLINIHVRVLFSVQP